jgi:hypothetical protein
MPKGREETLEILADIFADMDEKYATLAKISDDTADNDDVLTDSEAQYLAAAVQQLDRAQTELKKLLRRARKI